MRKYIQNTMFPSNKNICNHSSDETFRMKISESNVVDDLFQAIQNIVAGTAVISNTVLSDTCFQYKIHLSNDSPLITLQYEMNLDEKDLLAPVDECKAVDESSRVYNNANKRNESLENTLPDRKETLFPLCHLKQEIPEVLSVLINIENVDDKKFAAFDDQTKVDDSEMNHCTKSMYDSISNFDASERKLFALLTGDSLVITPVKKEKNGNSEKVVQNKKSEQMESNKINTHEERGAVIENKFNCSYCGKLFKDKSAKELHERIHTGEKLFKSEECGKAFIRSAHLTHHKTTHAGEKPFTCDECGKAFTQSCNLTEHKKTHTGEKPFTCKESGKAFAQKEDLTRHKRLHTGEKTFTCRECGKAFTESGSLQRHKKIHEREKSLICNVCDETVSCADLNYHHKKYHMGKSIFSCKHCDRSFAYSRNLNKHIKIHHPGELLKCEECGEEFPRLHLLSYHKRIHM